MVDLFLIMALSVAEHDLGIPHGLLTSICAVESGLNPKAVHKDDGRGNSVGLCQVKLDTARTLGFKGTEKDLLDPVTNYRLAGRYLAKQAKRYDGSWSRAVVAYNRGKSTSRANTNQYFRKVMYAWSLQ